MQVREITTPAEMDRLRSDWDSAFALDPHASPFMSWAWQRGWMDVTPDHWMVLAARQSERSPFVGFLPISLRGSRSALRIDHLREVHSAGEPTADYAGFVCKPELEKPAIAAIARHMLQAITWDRLRFEEWRDPRLPLLLAQMPANCVITDQQGTACPRMPLPATWDDFLKSLSSSTRQSLRRRLRNAERQFQSTSAIGPAITEKMIDGLIHMALHRTRANLDSHTHRLGSMVRRCAEDGLAHMTMLWKDDVPVAGVAGLIDSKEASFGLYVTAFDETFSDQSPGRVVVALAIRNAIEMNLRVFDFLRGEEPYKFQFGGVSVHNRTLIIERHTLQASLRRRISDVRERLRI